MFKFFKKKDIENSEDILILLRKIRKENKFLKEEIERMKEESNSFIRKTDVSRYNPFSQIGGNQSFSTLFLDKRNNGVIITGLYTEGGSRVYSKVIKDGKSEYSLSKEEREILEKNTNE